MRESAAREWGGCARGGVDHLSLRHLPPTRPGFTLSPPHTPTPPPTPLAGRSWDAAELRLKSQADLHALWFLCLKERNMLLSERLYYRQVGQAAPEGERLRKVRKTMAKIKVVVGERARAAQALARDTALIAKLKAGETWRDAPGGAAVVSVGVGGRGGGGGGGGDGIVCAGTGGAQGDPVACASDRGCAAQFPRHNTLPPPPTSYAYTRHNPAPLPPQPPGTVPQPKRFSGKTVTYKKWGHKYTVPEELAPKTPTRQQKKVAASRAAYFARVRALRAQMDAAEAAVGIAPVGAASRMGGGTATGREER